MKKAILMLLILALLVGLMPVQAMAETTGPQKDSTGIYQIGTPEELQWFAAEVNSGSTDIRAVLTANINMSGVTAWPGIGTEQKPFKGSFDGQNHTVTFHDAPVGLFGYIKGKPDAIVHVKNVTIAGSVKNSGFAQRGAYVHFTRCINRATINYFASYVGGILGAVYGDAPSGPLETEVKFIECGNEASVTAGGSHVGGILGHSSANTRFTGCYNTGAIHGGSYVGGIAGRLQGSHGDCTVSYCYNTGRVSTNETSEFPGVAGIVGYMENNVSVQYCYNTGRATYAITGRRYNNTATIKNSYYLGTHSVKCSPDFVEKLRTGREDYSKEIETRATALSGAFMASEEFADLMGNSFEASCPTPVLSWQKVKSHTDEESCENCDLGNTEKEEYTVTFQESNGFTISGDDTVEQGAFYEFTLNISEGYEMQEHVFAVKVNGVKVDESDGKYTWLKAEGPLSITVVGVIKIPGNHDIKLPGTGNGYRITGEKTAKRDEDYTFTFSLVNGFKTGSKFKIIAHEILPENAEEGAEAQSFEVEKVDGVYTIPKVQKDYRIEVVGVEAVPDNHTVTINFSITEGENEFYVNDQSGKLMMEQQITVPYFDLSLYGLEKYYYNPYCYVDENDNIRPTQQKGTPESALNNITLMHAYIALTERILYKIPVSDVGKGISYANDPAAFRNAISWSQDAGSSFMDFWDFGTNLNYYVDYVYPLAYSGWGSTSDQILIQDNQTISIHMITGSASGSRFGFFSVNDDDKKFTGSDIIDYYEVEQGKRLNLTLFWSKTTGNYSTGYETIAGKQLYWISADEVDANMLLGWNSEPFGRTESMITDNKGTVTINTGGMAPGTYYIGALGGWTDGGAVDNAGFVSAGGETGPAFIKLVITESEGMLGDVNEDGQVTARDAAKIQRYAAGLITEINHYSADVNFDGQVTARDAAKVQRYAAGLITSFD